MSSPNPNPINYMTLFQRVGKLVKYYNLFYALQGGNISLTAVSDIQAEYAGREDLLPNIVSTFAGFQSNVQNWDQSLKTLADGVLGDLQVSLNAQSASTTTILPLLVDDMLLNSQTVQKNTIAALNIQTGVITGTQVGNGMLFGWCNTSAGIPDERITNEYVTFVCTIDQYGGASAGGETFSVTGWPSEQYYQNPAPFNKGNGSTSLTVANEGGSNLLINGDFESVTTAVTGYNTPSGWAFSNTSAYVFSQLGGHANNSTQCLGLGAYGGNAPSGTITISQNIASVVSTENVYGVAGFLKAFNVSNGSNLAITISGTGISTYYLYNQSPSSLSTSGWNVASGFFSIGSTIPSNLSLTISWTSPRSAGSTANVFLDDFVLVSPTYFGNVGYFMVRGTADFLAGNPDSFGVVTGNNFAGVFQTFFASAYQVALPSSGSPSISDSLAT